ncbi:MAG TPA: phosphodiester glycosidase family protein [Abditibacteriaceae bacterium]|jgi:hypothetical protein
MLRRLFYKLNPQTRRVTKRALRGALPRVPQTPPQRARLYALASLALTPILWGLWPAPAQNKGLKKQFSLQTAKKSAKIAPKVATKALNKVKPKPVSNSGLKISKAIFKTTPKTSSKSGKPPTPKSQVAKPQVKKLVQKPIAQTAALPRSQATNAKPITAPIAPPVSVPVMVPTPTPAPPPLPATPPLAQAYAVANPPAQSSRGEIFVPIQFLANGMGASVGPLSDDTWRVIYFDHTIDLVADQTLARFGERDVTLPQHPRYIGSTFYVPLQPFADWFGFQYKIVKPAAAKSAQLQTTTFLLTYPAAIVENIQTRVLPDKVQTVVTLSNPTRIVAAQNKLDVNISLAAARRPEVAPTQTIRDYLVPRTTLSSGNWHANFSLRTNYMAPVQWFTSGNPARVVIEVQRLFEEAQTNSLSGGIAFTKIRKGTNHGPVQMFLARVDPQDGWRVRVAPAGYSVLQRARPSVLASRHRALLAVNGGFFAYDGAAVGAMLVNNEWIRLPWGGRTAIGFKPDGTAQIGNLQAIAEVQLGGEGGQSLPVRELNGWPDGNRITALTTRFGPSYKLKSSEMAIVVKGGKVIARPGGGYAPIYGGGFTLVGSGGARPYLEKIARGEKAQLKVSAPGWEGVTTALGGGPRLVENGQVRVTGENFRADVRVGRGPRTAMGIDKNGGYIILVVDGRQGYYSSGMTLTELAYTMLKFGAVDAINFDGGGSTAMVVRNRIINRPSDGRERSVSNALVVMR